MKTAVHRIPGLVLTDHVFSIPLRHDDIKSEAVSVFAREVVSAAKEKDKLPWLVFFQGGPGFGSPRPMDNSGWVKRAAQDFRILLLDQRGTGRSTPLTYQTLAKRGSGQAIADYLKHFRADAIVRDAEWIRRELLPANEKWTALGQSYGGFVISTYLSFASEGLKEAMITGGVPSVTRPAAEVYRAAYPRVREKNRQYFERYPGDQQRAAEIARFLDSREATLPGGGRLTTRRFQQLGLDFGMSDGFERVHYLLEDAFVDGPAGRELSYGFVRGFENALAFETNPIFAILHEAIYGQKNATRWAAQAVRAEFPEFDATPDMPFLFTGEMIYPWMFEDYARLGPLREAADILAEFDGWPMLYDIDRLQHNTVPVAAAVYYNDMYVSRIQSEETANTIKGMKLWVTSEYEHNGLRAEGDKIVSRLLGMLRGEI